MLQTALDMTRSMHIIRFVNKQSALVATSAIGFSRDVQTTSSGIHKVAGWVFCYI